LRFNRCYPLFDRAEVVFDLSDIAPDRPQVLKDQVFDILSHGFDSGLRYGKDSSVFCESKAKGKLPSMAQVQSFRRGKINNFRLKRAISYLLK
jgi:hypothetical protein